MKKTKIASSDYSKKDVTVKTDLGFEELMKKALNTPLPADLKKKKAAKKKPSQK